MSLSNTRGGNAAHMASGKRKSTGDQVGSTSKKVALQHFPTHPNHDANGGLKGLPCTSLLNGGPYPTNVQPVSPETQEDPFYRFLKHQYETMRQSCKQYFNHKYNDLLRQEEERTSRICREKDLEMAHLKNIITCLQEKLAYQNEEINKKNTELDDSRRRNVELEQQVAHYKSQVENWKVKAERAEEMPSNVSVSPRRPPPYHCEDEEDTALSSVGETREG